MDRLLSGSMGEDGTIYIGSEDGHLYALNPVDGSVEVAICRRMPLSAPRRPSARTVRFTSALTIGISMHSIAADGSLKWTYRRTDVATSPAIGTDGTVYFGSDD